MSATIIIYVGKCAVSFLMFLCRSDLRAGFSSILAPGCARFGRLPACFLPLIPGGLFAAYDTLSFLSLSNLDPATYQILVQLRIVWVGILWQLAFHRNLSATQWFALLL